MLNINSIDSLLSYNNKSLSTNNNSSVSFSNTMQSVSQNKSLDSIFEKAARTYDVPVSLLKAIGKAESGFNPDAVSKAGAQGVMQLMPATAKSLGVVDPFDAEQNIMGGAKYISQMLDKYNGDVELALAAYNAGSGNVAKYGGIPPFKETQNYVKKVMGYANEDLRAGDYTPSEFVNNTLTRQVEKEIVNFSDFTMNKYLIFVESLKTSMSFSLFDAISYNDDNYYKDSENVFNSSNNLLLNNTNLLGDRFKKLY